MTKRIFTAIAMAMLFIGFPQVDKMLAQMLAQPAPASWAEIKSGDPASKPVVSGRKAGGMHSIILRQPIQIMKFTEGVKDAFVYQDQGDLVIDLSLDAAQVPRETGYFSLVYSFQGNQIKLVSSFFGYDEARTYYMVRFAETYVGSPAQSNLVSQEPGQGILTVSYVEYSSKDYDSLWTTVNLDFSDLDFTLVRLQPLGEFPSSQLDLRWEQVAMSGDITVPLKHLSFVVKRDPLERFFEISAGGFSWTVQLPFVPELEVALWNGGASVGPPRP